MDKSFFHALDNISLKEYAPVPFWSWNNKIEIEECKRQIRQMKKVGFGGFIIHARAGLKTEYLSKDWFSCVEACIEEAKKQAVLELELPEEDLKFEVIKETKGFLSRNSLIIKVLST